MRKLTLIVLAGLFSVLSAVNFVSATGEKVESPVRDSLAYYHNNSDDLHWYGSDSWAVLFDFNHYYESIDSLQFEAHGAYIYIPNQLPDDELTVRLCENDVNQPGQQLETQTIVPVLGWNEITFSQTHTDTLFWLIVDYPTNSVDQFIAASTIDGSHSYYFQNDYYYNLAQSGFTSEFLFSLAGNFLIQRDIELTDFRLQIDENYYQDGSLNFDAYPAFTAKNNSNIIFNNNYIAVTILYPLWTISDTIYIPSIPAHGEVSMNYYQNPLHKYDLLRRYSQYEIDARLFDEMNLDDLPDNNEKSYYLNIFPYEQDKIFVENFMRLASYNNDIWNDEALVLNPDSCLVMNYFSDISDSLYCQGAIDRFGEYGLFGYPVTIVGGEQMIIGFNDDFPDLLYSYSNFFFENAKSFLLETRHSATRNSQFDVNFSFTLKNEKTYIFPDYFTNSHIYIAIAEDNVQLRESVFGSVLLDILYNETNPQLNCEDSLTTSVQFNEIYNVNPINTLLNCKLVYWAQNMETGKIEFLNSIPFSEFEFTEADDEEISNQPIGLEIFPNPFSPGKSLHLNIASERSFDYANLEIFNIKGQKIRTLECINNVDAKAKESLSYITWNGKDESGRFVSSGIYFLKLNLRSDGRTRELFRNCVFLR